MSGEDNARALLEAFSGFDDDTTGSGYTPAAARPPRLATVDPAYNGVGDPKVTFDGELTMSTKTYPCLNVKPLPGDRVVLIPVGHGYLILGGIGGHDPTPTGTITAFAGSVAPPKHVLCTGQELSTMTDAALFAVIGYTYGGSGATFNVPNLKGRVPVGFDSGQAEFDALGETGGAKTHTLTTAEMPSHNHGGSTSSNPAYNTTNIYGSGGTVDFVAHNWDGSLIGGDPAYQNRTIHSHTISAQGGGAAHNNLQPYMALNYIIKL